jgi:hypothetical protein
MQSSIGSNETTWSVDDAVSTHLHRFRQQTLRSKGGASLVRCHYDDSFNVIDVTRELVDVRT